MVSDRLRRIWPPQMDKADCTLLYMRIWYYTQYFPKTPKQPRVHLTTNNTHYITPPINPKKQPTHQKNPKIFFLKNRLPNRHPPHQLYKLLLFRWAAENRKPMRRYRSIPKHFIDILLDFLHSLKWGDSQYHYWVFPNSTRFAYAD